MHDKVRRYGLMIVFGLTMAVMNSQVVAEKMERAKPAGEATTLELSISADGRSIVDQNGKEVARFKKGMQVKPAKAGAAKMQGCMCCEKTCIRYDNNGNCIQEINSCTWDFECSCKKK